MPCYDTRMEYKDKDEWFNGDALAEKWLCHCLKLLTKEQIEGVVSFLNWNEKEYTLKDWYINHLERDIEYGDNKKHIAIAKRELKRMLGE